MGCTCANQLCLIVRSCILGLFNLRVYHCLQQLFVQQFQPQILSTAMQMSPLQSHLQGVVAFKLLQITTAIIQKASSKKNSFRCTCFTGHLVFPDCNCSKLSLFPLNVLTLHIWCLKIGRLELGKNSYWMISLQSCALSEEASPCNCSCFVLPEFRGSCHRSER